MATKRLAFAALAVGGLQLGQVFDVDMDEAEVVVAEGALALGGTARHWPWPTVQAVRLENAPDVVATEVQQEVADDEGQVVEREVSAAPQGTDDGAFLPVAFQGSRCGRAERSRQSAAPRLRHLRTVSALTP